MDELYGLHSSVDDYYSAQQIEDNMVSNWSSYEDFSSHVVNFGDRDVYTDYYSKNNGDDGSVYGSDQLWSSAGGSSGLSDAASSVGMVAENKFIIQRNNNNNGNNNNNNKENNKNINNDDNGLSSEEDASSVIREKIASHHLYPKLLQAYIDCRKVGAPPEMADILDDIKRGTDDNASERNVNVLNARGSDPELDDFMETYCDILVKYKSDLSKPFDEAATFLSSMETQLSKLCDGVSFGGDSSAMDLIEISISISEEVRLRLAETLAHVSRRN